MKTGIELIAEERREQLTKHKRSVNKDVKLNTIGQLSEAAGALAAEFFCDGESMRDVMTDLRRNMPPTGWNLKIWQKMFDKPYRERLIIAGALIAAEIDRLQKSKQL